MAGDLLIRTVEQADLPALLELYRDLNPSDPPLALADATLVWRQISNYTGCTIFVGVLDKALITSCTLVIVPNLTRGGLPYALRTSLPARNIANRDTAPPFSSTPLRKHGSMAATRSCF
jgi:hypothetical protein